MTFALANTSYNSRQFLHQPWYRISIDISDQLQIWNITCVHLII